MAWFLGPFLRPPFGLMFCTLSHWLAPLVKRRELAASYLRIIIPSLPILVASIVASAVLRSHGAASSSMYVTILGGVVNAILDPIFIFALDMNLAGAAWASVAARIASASLSFYFLFKNHGGLEAPERVGLAA